MLQIVTQQQRLALSFEVKMKIVDLQIRMARQLASGKGSIQLTQTDLDVLVHSGAYAALCEAATQELKGLRPSSTSGYNAALPAQPKRPRGVDASDALSALVMQPKSASKHLIRSRSTAPILPTLIKSSERK